MKIIEYQYSDVTYLPGMYNNVIHKKIRNHEEILVFIP